MRGAGLDLRCENRMRCTALRTVWALHGMFRFLRTICCTVLHCHRIFLCPNSAGDLDSHPRMASTSIWSSVGALPGGLWSSRSYRPLSPPWPASRAPCSGTGASHSPSC